MIIALLQVRIICAVCGADFTFNTRVDSSQRLHVPQVSRSCSRAQGWDTETEGDVIRDICPKCKAAPDCGGCGLVDCVRCFGPGSITKAETRDEKFNELARDFAPELEGT